MATPLVANLQRELEDIDAQYQEHFAGQSRATRDLSRMDDLIAKTKSVVDRIKSIPVAAMGKDLTGLNESATQQLDMLRNERVLIEKAKVPVPGADTFAPLALVANFTFAKYRRHYAGKSRNTRDVLLLDEMIDDLKKIESGMKGVIAKTPSQPFRDDLGIVKSNLEMYEAERREIAKAQETGTAEERGGTLANLANEQFAVYRDHFAGKGRVTRRPQLLARVIANLESVHARMQALEKAADKPEFNAANLAIVEQNMSMYRLELVEIKAARESTPIADLMGNLGDAANQCFAAYRDAFAGRNRTTVSRDALSVICDQLDEIHRQMRDLARVDKNEMNLNNMGIVADQLTTFNAEYDEISKAQGIA